MVDRFDIGGPEDSFTLRTGGVRFLLTESYEITASVFKQPSACTIRLGRKLAKGDDYRERLVSEILDVARPGSTFELLARAPRSADDPRWIGIQSGILDSRGSPAAESLQVELRGRDFMARVFDSFVTEERAFTEKTYYDLTRKVLDLVGLTEEKGHHLLVDDTARKEVNPSRRSISKGGTITPTQSAEEIVREVQTGAMSGTGKTLYKAPKIKLGTRYYDFLQQQYKLAGLFLMATGEGSFFLTRPHRYLLPEARLTRKSIRGANGQRIERGNILTHAFTDDTTQRHSKAIVYGRGGGGKAGRNKFRGECTDEDMTRFGIDKPIVIHDEDVKSNEEAAYVARRILGDERRESWKLVYTVVGHTTPNTASLTPGARAFWTPDTTVIVDDDQLGIHDTLWIESVTFRRGPEGTSTRIELCHPSDLDFAPPPEKPKVFASSKPKNREVNVEKSAQDLTGQPAPSPLLTSSPNTDPALREGGSGGTSSTGPGFGQRETGSGGAGGFGPARTVPRAPSGPSSGSQAGGSGGAGGASGFGSGGSGGAGGF